MAPRPLTRPHLAGVLFEQLGFTADNVYARASALPAKGA